LDALPHHRGDLKIERHAAAVVYRGQFPHLHPPERPKILPKKSLSLPSSAVAISEPALSSRATSGGVAAPFPTDRRASRFCAKAVVSRLARSWTRPARLNCASIPVSA